MRPLLLALLCVVCTAATFESLPATELTNGKLSVMILERGASIGSMVLTGDAKHRSPLWNPIAASRNAGAKETFGASLGHFLCLDGFGGTSPEEQSAGYPFHGEAYTSQWTQKYTSHEGGTAVLTLAAHLPLANEDVQRTYRMADGEQVMSVETEVESLLAFDRPMQWAEHATIGAPFLKPGVTFIDMSATKGKTRTYQPSANGLPHRLPSGKEFTWPNAPLLNGGSTNLRDVPLKPNSGDHSTQLMKPNATNFITMLNTEQHLLLGYLFSSNDYPWTQSWEYYPSDGQYARGLEFSTQAFDVPRREVVQQGSMFGAPLYRWLPAKSKVRTRFLMFLTEVPNDLKKVDDVRVEHGAIVIEDRSSHRTVRLTSSLTL